MAVQLLPWPSDSFQQQLPTSGMRTINKQQMRMFLKIPTDRNMKLLWILQVLLRVLMKKLEQKWRGATLTLKWLAFSHKLGIYHYPNCGLVYSSDRAHACTHFTWYYNKPLIVVEKPPIALDSALLAACCHSSYWCSRLINDSLIVAQVNCDEWEAV